MASNCSVSFETQDGLIEDVVPILLSLKISHSYNFRDTVFTFTSDRTYPVMIKTLKTL